MSDLPIDSAQDANEIEMLEARENWSIYRLADGTTLRIKPVMIAVFRAEGQLRWTPNVRQPEPCLKV